jgi:hypothetical protein
MENNTEYIMVKQLTKKENRKNLIKIFGGALLCGLFAIASMYMFLFFILWANEVTEKVAGYF